MRSIREAVTAYSFSSKTNLRIKLTSEVCPVNVCNNSRDSTEKTLICLDPTTRLLEALINAKLKGFSGPTDHDDNCFSLVKDHSITLLSSPHENNLPRPSCSKAVIRPA